MVVDGEFRAFWALDRAQEKEAFERLVDFLTERLAGDPDMHVYHYANYERSALRRLAGEWGTREEEVDELLRREVFVDLFRVVVDSLRISYEGYGLKNVERFFMPERTEDVSAGDDSIIVFEQWLESRDDELLHAIERYNEFDCRATLALRDWLLERRAEAGVDGLEGAADAPRDQRGEGGGARRPRGAAAAAARRRRGRRRALDARAAARVPPARGAAGLVALLPPARGERGGAAPRLGGDRGARADGRAARAAQEVARLHALVPDSAAQARSAATSSIPRPTAARQIVEIDDALGLLADSGAGPSTRTSRSRAR